MGRGSSRVFEERKGGNGNDRPLHLWLPDQFPGHLSWPRIDQDCQPVSPPRGGRGSVGRRMSVRASVRRADGLAGERASGRAHDGTRRWTRQYRNPSSAGRPSSKHVD